MSLIVIRRFAPRQYTGTMYNMGENRFCTDFYTINDLLGKDLLRQMHVQPVHTRQLAWREMHVVRTAQCEYAAIARNAGGRLVTTGNIRAIEEMLRTLAAHDLLCSE